MDFPAACTQSGAAPVLASRTTGLRSQSSGELHGRIGSIWLIAPIAVI